MCVKKLQSDKCVEWTYYCSFSFEFSSSFRSRR